VQCLSRLLTWPALLTPLVSGHAWYFLSHSEIESVDTYPLELRPPAPGTLGDSRGLWSQPDGTAHVAIPHAHQRKLRVA